MKFYSCISMSDVWMENVQVKMKKFDWMELKLWACEMQKKSTDLIWNPIFFVVAHTWFVSKVSFYYGFISVRLFWVFLGSLSLILFFVYRSWECWFDGGSRMILTFCRSHRAVYGHHDYHLHYPKGVGI